MLTGYHLASYSIKKAKGKLPDANVVVVLANYSIKNNHDCVFCCVTASKLLSIKVVIVFTDRVPAGKLLSIKVVIVLTGRLPAGKLLYKGCYCVC